jgi:glycosyltransferase involved in cell wall biosynthesis
MKIVFTAPFWSREVNSISRGPIYIATQGHDVLIITSQKSDSLKGKVSAPSSETVDGAEFFRPYLDSKDLTWHPKACWSKVREKVAKFQPDVIVGFGDPFYRLPLKLSRYFNVPLVMFFEYLRLDKFSLPIRGSGEIRNFFPGFYCFCSGLFRRYLLGRCSAVMFSYYGDLSLIPEVEGYCSNIHYVPWCTETDDEQGEEKRNRKVGVYIGSLNSFKNAAELVKAIPLILDYTATKRFIVVGPGDHVPKIMKLAERYGSRLEYIESVSRPEAMRLLRSVGYGYTPVTNCGLGFIGDCWGTGTPLITTHELDGFLNKDVDTLVANGTRDLPNVIDSLLESSSLFERMQQGGLKRYASSFTARAVGEKYLEILRKVVQPWSEDTSEPPI